MLKPWGRTLIALAAAAAALTTHHPLQASIGGVKSMGMAGVGVAYPQDAMNSIHNPAGAAFINDRLDIEATWEHNRGRAVVSRSPLTDADGSYDAYRTRNLFPFSGGLNKIFCRDGFVVGLNGAIYNRYLAKTSYHEALPLLGTSAPGFEYLLETITSSLALRWCDIALGVGCNYMVQRLKVNGLQEYDRLLRSRFPGCVTSNGYAYSHGVGYFVGFMWDLCDWLRVGAAYQPRIHMQRLHKYRGLLAQRGRLDVPQLISGGMTCRIMGCVNVCAEAQHLAWGDIKALHQRLSPNIRESLFGCDDGPGFGWGDQTFYRLGMDWMVNAAWTLRAGYYWTRNPFPPKENVLNMLTLEVLEQHLTVGASYRPNDCHELSLFYAHAMQQKRNGSHAIPAMPLGGGAVTLERRRQALGLAWGIYY